MERYNPFQEGITLNNRYLPEDFCFYTRPKVSKMFDKPFKQQEEEKKTKKGGKREYDKKGVKKKANSEKYGRK